MPSLGVDVYHNPTRERGNSQSFRPLLTRSGQQSNQTPYNLMMTNTASITPPTFNLFYDDWGKLVLVDAAGVRHEGVTPIRSFPLTHPENWICICDAKYHELVSIEEPSQLPAATRELLFRALAKTEFMPVISRLVDATIGEPAEWQVETNRGNRTFVLKSEDDIRALSDGRIVVTDSDGLRYMIADVQKLDAHSRRTLERFT